MTVHSRAVALSVLVAVLGACQQPATITELRGQAMGTAYTIKVVLPAGVQRGTVEKRLSKLFEEFDLLFSTYEPKSEISRFNRHASAEPFRPSAEFRAMLLRALRLARRTGGAFDPTIGPVLRLYGFGPGAEEPEAPPGDAEIELARLKTGWPKVVVGRTGGVLKATPEVELDFNAIAKGAGVDVVAKALDGLGCESYMVEIGGEVRCRGRKPGGKAWRLGIALPGAPSGEFADKADLVDRAMATSGSYMQFRDIGRQRVHHILDPRTGRNAASKVFSVTVIANTCELADGLATALMVLGPDEGDKVLASFEADDVQALFLIRGEKGVERREYRWR